MQNPTGFATRVGQSLRTASATCRSWSLLCPALCRRRGDRRGVLLLKRAFLGEASPTKIDHRKKGTLMRPLCTLILASLLEDLVKESPFWLFPSFENPFGPAGLTPLKDFQYSLSAGGYGSGDLLCFASGTCVQSHT